MLVLSLFAILVAQAQSSGDPETFEGRTIAQVEFDPANQPLPVDELARLLPFQAGSTLKLADVRAAIQKLYATGRYSDVAISGTLDGAGTVTVRIATQLAYFVSGITIQGVDEPPTKGQLVSATKLELGKLFEESVLEQANENMLERLRANGLYHATVTHSVDRNPDTEEVQIHFDIIAGARARFDGVSLMGDTAGKSTESIVNETRWRRGFGPVRFPGWKAETESLVQKGVNRVLESFQRGDHLQAAVTLEGLDYHDTTNTVTPTLSLMSGPILEVHTTGAKVSTGKLRQLIPMYQERTVDRSLLIEGRRNLVEFFQSQGYFDAAVDFEESTPGPGEQVVTYNITENLRHKLVHIDITGNHYFDESTLRERLFITPARFPSFASDAFRKKCWIAIWMPFGRFTTPMDFARRR